MCMASSLLIADDIYISGNQITVCNADNGSGCYQNQRRTNRIVTPKSSPSFDCRKAKKRSEIAICNNSRLCALDLTT